MLYLRSPRNTSPSASARVLPCSKVIILASSFWNINHRHQWGGKKKRTKTDTHTSIHFPPGGFLKIKPASEGSLENNIWASEMSPYYVILNELLVAQEDLLPAEDGGLRPGAESPGAGVHSRQHLLLGRFWNSSHHLISGLRSKRDGPSQTSWLKAREVDTVRMRIHKY